MKRKDSSTPKIIVEALGFQGTNAIPLLFTHEAHKQKLVINAYNSLMKDIQTAYSSAARRNDEESKALIVGICHELYHHTPHVEGDSDSLDSHEIEVRNQVYSGVLDVLQKYIDLKG